MQITVVNIKCGGCARTITKTLEELGATEVHVDTITGRISFEGWPEKSDIISRLSALWYPEVWSAEAEQLLKKAKSYISCAIGKIS